jgi:hypothetical protein
MVRTVVSVGRPKLSVDVTVDVRVAVGPKLELEAVLAVLGEVAAVLGEVAAVARVVVVGRVVGVPAAQNSTNYTSSGGREAVPLLLCAMQLWQPCVSCWKGELTTQSAGDFPRACPSTKASSAKYSSAPTSITEKSRGSRDSQLKSLSGSSRR